MNLVEDLKWRGLFHQATEAAEKRISEGNLTVYVGFDPTADSLHCGSLLPLTILRRCQQAGLRPIALVGGATGMIGDPSGKSKERTLLSVDTLRANVVGMERQMRRFLDFEGDNPAVLVNNFDWMRKFDYLDFLRDVGKNFPVNVMLAKDSVKSRLSSESGLSYTEFSYMLLQAYDFVHLNREYGCELQVGGSDQWGNITAGIDLGRRMHSATLHGLTCPLLTTSAGMKMGKTEEGTVWLSPDRTSPFQFYQYWLNTQDDDVDKCLRFLTDLQREEIETLARARAEAPQKRESQKALAASLTELVHGDDGLKIANRATEILFGGAPIEDLTNSQLQSIFSDVPSETLAKSRLEDQSLSVIDAFVESGLCKSKNEARRTIQDGGAYMNNRRTSDLEYVVTSSDLASETMMVLRRGKKRFALLQFE